jgi:valyl-tRNA synthetase
MVRDKLGRKMSKSLGNSPDPIKLMENYGADGVRVGMLLTSPAGNDLPFDESLCEQGRNFTNKIWNALRLVKGWEVDNTIEQPDSSKVAIQWLEAKLNDTIKQLEDHFSKYRISDALMSTYKLIWDDFCSWYLEMIKPAYQKPIDKLTLNSTIEFFERIMKIAHPFVPFISEEVYQILNERTEDDSIMISNMPEASRVNRKILEQFDFAKEVINATRSVRASKNIPMKESMELLIKKNNQNPDLTFDSTIAKLCNLSKLDYVDKKADGANSFLIKSTEFYIPLSDNIDVEAEIKKLEEELKYTNGFLNSISKKLSNERFVNNAPEKVVAMERKKQADAEARIAVIEEQLKTLK